MTIPVSLETLFPVIAVALDEAWGNRYEEHAVEELDREAKHIAHAILSRFNVTRSGDREAFVGPKAEVSLASLPMGTLLFFRLADSGHVVKKTRTETFSQWSELDGSMVWAEWEIDLIGENLLVLMRGTE